ncbi:NlpC/P60 family protein [Paenibacillus sp. S-38]|uniref:C40 family peptidase n=1 Tax=Paenibacillus sp. S-38 TaxID=3416710 RepID=UPI003CF1738B
MTELKAMQAAVSVATVWTSPDSPRPLDEPALRVPADAAGWARTMTLEEKLDLYAGSRVQTQILYGSPVLAAEERDGWTKLLIPEQSTAKEPRGYPGWVPSRQLAASLPESGGPWAVVCSPRTVLSFAATGECLELSFLTKLPVIGETGSRVRVDTPHGPGSVPRADVRISGTTAPGDQGGAQPPAAGQAGEELVRQGLRFAGLPYLWGGMSSYGYDCSGFAHSMHRALGLLIPRDASDQAVQGEPVEADGLLPGDLLFFAHEQGRGRVHHVGIYAGEGRMLHSPDSAGRIELVRLAGYKLAEEHCASRRYWSGRALVPAAAGLFS